MQSGDIHQSLPGASREGFLEHQNCHVEHYCGKDMSKFTETMPRVHTDASCMFWVTHVQLPRHNQGTPLVGDTVHGGGCVDVGSTGI